MKRTVWVWGLCCMLSANADPITEAWKTGQTALEQGNLQRAIDIWFPLAGNGNAASQIQLETIFDANLELARTNPKAVCFFNRMAKNNDSTKLLLARIYLTENNEPKATYWLEQILASDSDTYKPQARAHLNMIIK